MSHWIYVCGACEIEMSKDAPAIACTNCLAWIHLKKSCANISYKEAKKVKKTFKCSKCIEVNLALVSSLLI